MIREDIKQLLPIIEAYANGKTIEVKNSYGIWEELADDAMWFHMEPNDYRIKQEPIYRPFMNIEECWNEMLKHQPFGWLKSKNENEYILRNIGRGDEFHYLYNDYTFADGTPFGIENK